MCFHNVRSGWSSRSSRPTRPVRRSSCTRFQLTSSLMLFPSLRYFGNKCEAVLAAPVALRQRSRNDVVSLSFRCVRPKGTRSHRHAETQAKVRRCPQSLCMGAGGDPFTDRVDPASTRLPCTPIAWSVLSISRLIPTMGPSLADLLMRVTQSAINAVAKTARSRPAMPTRRPNVLSGEEPV